MNRQKVHPRFIAAKDLKNPGIIAAMKAHQEAGNPVTVTFTESERENLDAITIQAKKEGFFVQLTTVG